MEETNKFEMIKLWENASPASSFTAQTISINLKEYNFISIVLSCDSHAGQLLTIKLSPDKEDNLLCCCDHLAPSNILERAYRTAIIPVDKSKIQFSDANIDNTKVIPLSIYGIKGVIK